MIENLLEDEEKIFGEKLENIKYIHRSGVYGVIVNNEGKVAVLKTITGYFLLPGGGIENNETHKECLERECLEEIGCRINVDKYLGKASMYHLSKQNKYILGIGYFYMVNLQCNSKYEIEKDKELVWMDPYECMKCLPLENQAWAVSKAIKYLL